ncbi:MAG TPA: alpha/beta fold hydrolase [Steroidobacteraceae bacterium]|nr:alpha/beta fold hydrolase [Steroidobacteraceae bacterium]
MRNLLVLLLYPAGVYATLCLLLFAVQRSQMYFPVGEAVRPGAQSIRVQNGEQSLKVWVVDRPGPRAILYFGGNAEDVSLNLPSFEAAFPSHSLYLVNYRGYGGSSGRPSERALLADATAVHDHVVARHPQVAVIGRSLGSGVAVHLASVRDVQRLALVSPFDSMVDVAREHYPWLPVGLLLLDRYESAARAAAIRAPVLIVIAGDDEIIPPRRSQALAAAFAPSQVHIARLPGATHNSLDLFPQYLESLAKFMAD